MENRAPGRGRDRARQPRSLLLIAGVGSVALLAGFWWFGGRADDNADLGAPVGHLELPSVPASRVTVPAPAIAASDAAMIVAADDTPEAEVEGATTASTAADNPFGAVAPTATAASATARPASPPSMKPVPHPAPTRAYPTANVGPSASAPKPATAAVNGSGDEDLLATLLKNIERRNSLGATLARADPAPFSVLERPQTGNDHDALESLVRQVRDSDSQRAAGTDAAVVGARALRSSRSAPASTAPAVDAERSSQVQARLRQCPRANTRQGLACRQKVCAKLAGQDSACPAPVRR